MDHTASRNNWLANDGLAEGGKIRTVLSHSRIVNYASPVSTISVVLDTHVENEGAPEVLIKCLKMQIGDCVHVWKGIWDTTCVYMVFVEV